MFHYTTRTHGHIMVLVGGYKECILFQDVFHKIACDFYFETEQVDFFDF